MSDLNRKRMTLIFLYIHLIFLIFLYFLYIKTTFKILTAFLSLKHKSSLKNNPVDVRIIFIELLNTPFRATAELFSQAECSSSSQASCQLVKNQWSASK